MDLIKYHVNPKICVLSNGDDWEYLNHLVMRFNANITILGSDFNLLCSDSNQKDYDLIIYQSNSSLSLDESSLLTYTLSCISLKFGKVISVIHSFRDETGSIVFYDAIVDGQSFKYCESQSGTAKGLREIIDIGMSNFEEYSFIKENESNHSLSMRR